MAEGIAQERSNYSMTWFGLVIFFIQIFTILVLIPTSWLVQVVDREEALLYQYLGNETASYVIGLGLGWYNALFVETGINSYVHSFFIPTEIERERTVGMETIGQSTWFPWIEGRGVALKLVIILFFERLAQMLIWLPFLIVMFLPAAWDGYMTWKMKFYSFEYSSPWFHRFSVRTIIFFNVISLVGIFVPFPIHPLILPMLGLLIAPMVAVALISNLPKKL